jgi:hypothetical protein
LPQVKGEAWDLQFLGDVILSQGDEYTSISLLTVTLEGFTRMDVHCSRTECVLRLGDISMGNNMLKAVELWETAKLFFERSNQAKQVEHVNLRLASVSENVLKQHRKILVHLAELNPPSGTVEDMDEFEDVEGLELGGGNRDLIVARFLAIAFTVN